MINMRVGNWGAVTLYNVHLNPRYHWGLQSVAGEGCLSVESKVIRALLISDLGLVRYYVGLLPPFPTHFPLILSVLMTNNNYYYYSFYTN